MEMVRLLILFGHTQPHKTEKTRHQSRCVKSAPFPVSSAAVAKISSPIQNGLPTPSSTSALPSQVELNFSTLLPSSRSSSLTTTATIPGLDFPVFTTDSTQSTWLPSSSSSLPAPSAQQLHLQPLDLPPHQQDFVLFDQPIKHRQPNRSVSQPSANGGVNQTNQQPRPQQQPQQQFFQQQASSSPSLQNQRVANIIQATGHQTTSSAFTNRFSSSAQNPHQHQFYASSAPSSSAALNLHKQNNQNRPHRPPVPLFSQSTGNIPHAKMNIQGKENFWQFPRLKSSHSKSGLDLEDFTAFEGGASTTAYSSPALPNVFDLDSSASSSTHNMGTISPHELLLSEPFMSAPNSTALTALTSPSIYNESPDFGDGFDVSPNFGSSDFEAGGDVWFPLFPPTNNNQETQKPATADMSPAQSDDLEVVEPTSAGGHQRRKSGNSHSPPSGRHSSVSGVSSRRRDKPLPPIIVEDPTDTIAMKRARNTLAARKSRERKAQRLDELEEKIEKLTADRDYWKNRAIALGATKE